MTIDSPQNRLVKEARALHAVKGRHETGLFLAEGPEVVSEAVLYAPGIEWIAWCPELGDGDDEALADAARQARIPVHEFSERAFHAMAATRSPQGIAAVIRVQVRDLDAIRCEDKAPVSVLALVDVRDPGNLGTMIRTADALGAAGVVLCGHCADPYEPKAVRATAGSLFHLPVVEADWRQAAAWVKDRSVKILATDLEASHVLGRVGFPRRAMVVVGNEAHGLPEQVLQDADVRVKIPMSGYAESLNAAVAAGIMLYEVLRTREG